MDNKNKIKKDVNKYLSLILPELEKITNKEYDEVFTEIWNYYEKNILENLPYVGGNKVSGTKNLTGALGFVAMGEVLKKYGSNIEEIGHLMVYSYERYFLKIPTPVRNIMGKVFNNPKLLNKMLLKKDLKNEKNAKENPGSYVTKTQIPPEEGYDVSYHNLVCPIAVFAKKYGYEEYMPYICNLDYVMFGVLKAQLYREHTCFADGDYCDFKLKKDAEILEYWPPVYKQDNPYK